MSGLTLGSLFSGYGGLDLAVEHALGARTVWHAEWEDAPSKVLARHWPGIPNLRDVTAVDWAAVQPVDVITGGFPCQDVSLAGRRAGMTEGTRSNLWGAMRSAIETIRPAYVVAENVRGLLSAKAQSASDMDPGEGLLGDRSGGHLRALGRVLGDLADLGYDTQWCGLRASDVGAPHHRFRVFILATRQDVPHPGGGGGRGRATGPEQARGDDATLGSSAGGDRGRESAGTQDADFATRGERGQSAPGQAESGRARPDAGRRGGAPAPDADGHEPERGRGHGPMAGTPGQGQGREEERQRLRDAPGHRGQDDQRTDWGPYAAAVHRWEPVVGRRAPAPTELTDRGKHRLSPTFTEWMMGLPAGWITDTPGLSRNDQLKMCGNGVVPQQAAAALHHMRPTHQETT